MLPFFRGCKYLTTKPRKLITAIDYFPKILTFASNPGIIIPHSPASAPVTRTSQTCPTRPTCLTGPTIAIDLNIPLGCFRDCLNLYDADFERDCQMDF